MELMTAWKDILCSCTELHDRLEELNQYTGDGVKQKIKNRSAHPVKFRMLTATSTFHYNRKKIHSVKEIS